MKDPKQIARDIVYCFSFVVILVSCSHSNNRREVNEKSPKIHIVEIKQMAFSPAEITVRKGDKVSFVNYDMVAHDITEKSSKAWSSSPLQPKQSWTFSPTTSADYYCSIHVVMTGKIVVE